MFSTEFFINLTIPLLIFIGNNIKPKYDKYLYDGRSYRPPAI